MFHDLSLRLGSSSSYAQLKILIIIKLRYLLNNHNIQRFVKIEYFTFSAERSCCFKVHAKELPDAYSYSRFMVSSFITFSDSMMTFTGNFFPGICVGNQSRPVSDKISKPWSSPNTVNFSFRGCLEKRDML